MNVGVGYRPELRPLDYLWFDGLVDILTPHTTAAAARSAAVFIDGALLHALSRDEPMDVVAPTTALRALLIPPA